MRYNEKLVISLMISCNPCYNGNDIQFSQNSKRARMSCNPCYNGNEIHFYMNLKCCDYCCNPCCNGTDIQ